MDVSTALVAAFGLPRFHSDKNRSGCRLWLVMVVWNHSPTIDKGGKYRHGRESHKEALRQKVIDLERRLKEHEQKGVDQDIQEVTKRLEKIAEMGDDGIIVFDEDYRD